ncbi:MAG TPA: ABC transporter ATP-binding protein, partial [Pirellulales bacterium]|nr:ABC transporter ATP-binding protein [Pirellulales bacterium]
DLTFDHVTKFYGPVIGVNNVSCRIGPGITGLLGANGAGKSTLIKLASGQLRPNQGSVHVGQHSAWSTAAKRNFGYSPDLDRFYEEMAGREFVYTMAQLYGYRRREARERTELALEEVGMTDRAERRLGGCSHGMRQRIKLAQALVHDPELLLLDEPLNGIDPGGRREINELLLRLAERGKAVLVSTHILIDVENLADTIVMISRGRIIASGTLAEVRNLLDDQPRVIEIVSDRARELASLLAANSDVRSVELQGDRLTVKTTQPARFFGSVAQLVVDHQFAVERVQTLDSGAEAVFDYLQRGTA